MGEPEPMTLSERRKYLRLLQSSYRSASRRQRSELLDEAERVTGRHRKSLIRWLRGNIERKLRSRQRGRSYGPQVEYAVRLCPAPGVPVCRVPAARLGVDHLQLGRARRTAALPYVPGEPRTDQRLHGRSDGPAHTP